MREITIRHFKFMVRHFKSVNLDEQDMAMMEDVIVHIAEEVSAIGGVISRLSPEAIAIIDDEIRKMERQNDLI